MKRKEVKELKHGLYFLWWKSGGGSVASVGSNSCGNRWLAPTNWINVPSFDWREVEYAELLTDQKIELERRNLVQ